MITIVNNLDGFANLESDWNLLFEEDSSYLPFQSYDYNYISWMELSDKKQFLYIICYYKEQEKHACGIFPFYIDSTRCVRFINDTHTDYQTALIRTDMRTNYAMYEDVFDHLMQDKTINRVFLNHIMACDMILPYFGHFSRNAKIYRTENYSLFEVKKLPSDNYYIDSLRHLSAKERNRLKNIDKKLRDINFSILNVSSNNNYPEDLMDSLFSSMINEGIRTEAYFTPSLKMFFKKLYDAGLISLALTYESGNICSASIFYMCRKNSYLIQWIILYTDKKYNLWNKLKTLEYLYQTGGGYFNFGRGAYPYKIQHFRPIIQNLFCLDIPKTDGLRFKLQVKESFCLFKTIIRRYMKKY